MKSNRSRYAILGVLSEGPASGYDIRKTIEQELSHFWNESYGQIYPILRALAEERLATRRRKKQRGKPDRQVYSITAKGRRALREWLSEPPSLQTERNETLLKLFFSGNLDTTERRELIEAYREKQRERLVEYEGIERSLEESSPEHPDLKFWLLTVSHGRAEARARIRWSDQVLREIEAREVAKGRSRRRA